MCGIAGFYNFNSTAKGDAALLRRMCDAVLHRGPDGSGQRVSGNVGIGMRRLSIIDRESGQQPIPNEDRSIWVVLNGEIYNHEELRRGLEQKGHVFRTASDTEPIVHLYEEFGESCVQHLRGMFAFAIWDENRRTLLIARDRLGIKPLFFADTGEKLVFGSEIKSILQDTTISRSMDLDAMDAYLAYSYIPAPLTIFKNIRKLEPGHTLSCSPQGVKIKKYWDLSFEPDNSKNEAQFSEEFLALFDDAVSSHLMSEVPLGAFLSGGIDSGLLVARMAHYMKEPVKTFTIGFASQSGNHLDERPYAREIGARYGVDHTELEVAPNVTEILDKIVQAFDEPFADDSVVPSFYICQLAKRAVTVALTGAGGDELFAGYDRYLGLSLSQVYSRMPGFLRNTVFSSLSHMIPSTSNTHYLLGHIKRFIRMPGGDEAARYRQYTLSLPDHVRAELYAPDVLENIQWEVTEELGIRHFKSLKHATIVDRALYQDLKSYLPEDILTLSDRLSMQHSLELRVPFLDHKLVEFCCRIPATLKLNGFTKKYLLKRIAATHLPSDVINHRKQGFSSPMAAWLRNELKELMCDVLSYDTLKNQGFFSPDAVNHLVNTHLSARESHEKVLFALIMFQEWYRIYKK